MSLQQLQKNMHTPKGFTLIELMVSLTVFSIVMLISVGTLLVIIDANAKAQALYTATTNLSFALDSITRELRTGYHYRCENPPVPSGDTLPAGERNCNDGAFIAFNRERDGVRVGYKLTNNILWQNINSTGWSEITSADVVIDQFELDVADTDTHNASNDTRQPSINLFIKGHTNNGLDVDTDFNVQTRILQRRLDIL